MRISPRVLLPFLAIIPVLQAMYFHPRLPQTVASHFGPDGQPDAWTDRSTFVMLNLTLSLLLIGLLAGLAFVGRWLIPVDEPASRRAADPQGAERRRQYREEVRRSFTSFATWFGLATAGFVLIVLEMAYRANLRTPAGRIMVLPVLIPYLAVVGVLVYRLVRSETRLSRLCPRELPAGIWFPAKRFGWGWGPPCCWQGWVFLLAWLAALFGGIALLLSLTGHRAVVFILPYTFVMAAVLIVVCWKKGERPQWRWGE